MHITARSSSENVRAASRWLVLIAASFSWLFFVSRYIHFPLYLVHRAIPGVQSLEIAILRVLYPIDLLFTRFWLYVLFSMLGLALTIVALVRSRPGWPGRVALLVGLLAIIALPFVYRYRPAVRVAPAYAAQVITQPGPFAGVVKSMRVEAEVHECDYELLGWSASQGALYGKKICAQRTHVWMYRPFVDERFRVVSSAPGDLVQETIPLYKLEGVHSVIPPANSLRLVIREPISIAPERGYCAFVARHIYGPEDVLVVATDPGES